MGARGDGVTLDTEAINLAISSLAKSGGGTVYFPEGRYLTFSIRLQSRITLSLDSGAIIVAAKPGQDGPGFDVAEPNEWGDGFRYQDFGHSHWRNSLIWGENLEDVSITGCGRIEGHALTRTSSRRPGLANKAISLKLCRNVVLQDFSVLMAGHFAVLATGVDHLVIENLKIDTIRDGLDIDCCQDVSIRNCIVNTMNDDAIVLKSSYALGYLRDTEKVVISDCKVTGYDPGTFLDGSFGKTQQKAPDRDGPTGRIKLGTESNGAFRNISISNCVFERSRGLALETVDGGVIENITINNISMREVSSSPIFIRLGNRARGPESTPVGIIRKVKMSDVVIEDADGRYPMILSGLSSYRIEDLELNRIRVVYRGGLTMEEATEQPEELINPFFMQGHPEASGKRDPFDPPELEKAYPEPSVFGILPAYGMFIRHAKGIRIRDLKVSTKQPDERPAFVLQDVSDCHFDRMEADFVKNRELFVLRDVDNFKATSCVGMEDTTIKQARNLCL
ncbi:MAG: right-handed parallel beta-helix repeat-containing protein [Verrucomicrobiae bacterium]|nr:right-handed parallel beta-helix repeat-containing protein [Verrucomicrobiae bacterium]